MARTRGVDVSAYQGAIDWARVYAHGERFAIIRADAGSHYADPTARANIEGARAAGLSVALYHYAKPMGGAGGIAQDADQEADHFITTIAPYRAHVRVVVVDIEEAYVRGAAAIEWLWRWVSRVRAAGFVVAIYTNPSYLKGLGVELDDRFLECPLWIAHWNVSEPSTLKPWPLGAWLTWQTGLGDVDGITGRCDVNVFNGDEAACAAFFDPDPCEKASDDDDAATLCEASDGPETQRSERLVTLAETPTSKSSQKLAAVRPGASAGQCAKSSEMKAPEIKSALDILDGARNSRSEGEKS